MKIIMISIDWSILNIWSSAQKRLLEYARLVDSIYVIVYSPKKYNKFVIWKNIHIFPTNSLTKFHFIYDAYNISKNICKNMDPKSTVITTQDPFETWFVGYLLKKKYKIWLNIQDHWNFFENKYWKKESLLNFIRYHIWYLILKKADSIRVVSHFEKEYLIKKWFLNIVNVPVYVDTTINIKKKYIKRERFNILMMSRFVKQKNIIFALNVFKKLIADWYDFYLNLVWKWDQYKDIIKFIDKNKLNSRILLDSRTDNVAEKYKNSDIFVLSSNYEWWWMTAIESTSFWTPVIMTNTWCAWTFIINNVSWILIKPEDEKWLYEAIIKMYNNPSFREKCIKNAMLIVKNIPNKKQTLDLYLKSWKVALQYNNLSWKN